MNFFLFSLVSILCECHSIMFSIEFATLAFCPLAVTNVMRFNTHFVIVDSENSLSRYHIIISLFLYYLVIVKISIDRFVYGNYKVSLHAAISCRCGSSVVCWRNSTVENMQQRRTRNRRMLKSSINSLVAVFSRCFSGCFVLIAHASIVVIFIVFVLFVVLQRLVASVLIGVRAKKLRGNHVPNDVWFLISWSTIYRCLIVWIVDTSIHSYTRDDGNNNNNNKSNKNSNKRHQTANKTNIRRLESMTSAHKTKCMKCINTHNEFSTDSFRLFAIVHCTISLAVCVSNSLATPVCMCVCVYLDFLFFCCFWKVSLLLRLLFVVVTSTVAPAAVLICGNVAIILNRSPHSFIRPPKRGRNNVFSIEQTLLDQNEDFSSNFFAVVNNWFTLGIWGILSRVYYLHHDPRIGKWTFIFIISARYLESAGFFLDSAKKFAHVFREREFVPRSFFVGIFSKTA